MFELFRFIVNELFLVESTIESSREGENQFELFCVLVTWILKY